MKEIAHHKLSPNLMKLKCLPRLGILFLVLLVISTFLPGPVYAKLVVEGSDADKADFDKLLEKCEGESKSFKELMDKVRKSEKTVTLKVGRNQPGVVVDAFGGGGTMTVDLDDVEKWPNPEKDPKTGEYIFPDDIPSWAGTICEQFAHILGEALHAATTGDGYDESHDKGFEEQNKVREDYGQEEQAEDTPPEKHNDHIDGVTKYNGHKEKAHIKDSKVDSITYEE